MDAAQQFGRCMTSVIVVKTRANCNADRRSGSGKEGELSRQTERRRGRAAESAEREDQRGGGSRGVCEEEGKDVAESA